MCYSLDYGYLTYQDLQEYDALYVDASAADFAKVTDWFLRGTTTENSNSLLQEFAQKGHSVLFNAASIQAPLLENFLSPTMPLASERRTTTFAIDSNSTATDFLPMLMQGLGGSFEVILVTQDWDGKQSYNNANTPVLVKEKTTNLLLAALSPKQMTENKTRKKLLSYLRDVQQGNTTAHERSLRQYLLRREEKWADEI